jgi:uncharacterized zinc-type alcohol dehydrogenase-like protein
MHNIAKIAGYATKGQGQDLVPIAYDPPQIGENEVRITVTHCGLCHTDIHQIDDDYELTEYPFVPGHEIVGYVSELGGLATNRKIGERVGIGWQGRSCGHCEWCLKGEEQLCMEIAECGVWTPYGGFSTSVVVDHRFTYPLPEDMLSEVAAVLMCGGISVYAPLRTYHTASGLKLGIMGLGGLGHLAIQFADALNYDVTVISTSADKEVEARKFGADHFIVSSDGESMRKYYYNFDLILCTATGHPEWERVLMTLKKRGRLILIGFPSLTMNPLDLVSHDLSITGSFIGNRAAMQEMLTFAHEHHIRPLIGLMPMSHVNQAIQKGRENKARYRIVLVNE